MDLFLPKKEGTTINDVGKGFVFSFLVTDVTFVVNHNRSCRCVWGRGLWRIIRKFKVKFVFRRVSVRYDTQPYRNQNSSSLISNWVTHTISWFQVGGPPPHSTFFIIYKIPPSYFDCITFLFKYQKSLSAWQWNLIQREGTGWLWFNFFFSSFLKILFIISSFLSGKNPQLP